METILAIIKEPQKAEDFIVYSARLASELHFNLHLTFLQEPSDFTIGQPPPSPAYASFLKAQKERAENALSELDRQVKKLPDEITGKISIDYSAEFADAIIFINDYVEEDKAHMVILEEYEEKTFWATSSIEMSVINNANCPVWVIPPKATYTTYKEIIYATDYHEEDLVTLKNLVKLTRNLSPAITALHITDNNDFDERIKQAGFDDIVRSKIDYQKITLKSLKEHKKENAAQLINGYAQSVDADLIVLLKENRNFFERIISSDPTKEIIKKTRLPVLVYRYK
jgi:nucleotide-binding universal stress UspA family protein